MSTFEERFAKVLTDIQNGPERLDQKGLAEVLGKKASVISSYKAGRARPSFDVLFLLKHRFGVSIDALMEDEAPEGAKSLMAPDDPWIKAHRGFLTDCRALHPEVFMRFARTIHDLAETERVARANDQSAKHG